MATTSEQDQDLTTAGQDPPPSTKDKNPEDVEIDKESVSEKEGSAVSTVSTKIQIFRNKEKLAKSRLIKAKNQLTELLESSTVKGTLPSKNAVRRAMNKIKTELDVIEKIVASLKEVYALSKIEDADTTIEALDTEVDEIVTSVDEIIETREKHVQERLEKGEEESVVLSNKSLHVIDDEKVSLTSSYVKQKQLEAKQANERLLQVEEEHRQKELELEKITAELQLSKQRADEA